MIHHVRRERSLGWLPAILTLRVVEGVPSLRKHSFLAALRVSFAEACERPGFRLVHYSVQADHLHLIVEAASAGELGSGMKSISARVARAVNRIFGRAGSVLAGRYHVRWLRSPREVRSALRYVLLNVRKHFRERHGEAPPVRLDAASSARWFDGWAGPAGLGVGVGVGVGAGFGAVGPGASGHVCEVASARTWLLRRGWRRRGLISPCEVPGVL